MKRKLVCCTIWAIFSGASPTANWAQQSVANDARQWLERMLQSAQTLSYEGTFIYVQGPHIEAMHIVNGGGSENQRRRLLSLSGPSREVVVSNNSVICLLPKRHMTFIGGERFSPSFPLSIPRELGQIESQYTLETLGEDRVAGLDAEVIAINPRDAWRFGYRLWLDRRNGMVLRSALLDEKGYPVEQFMFTDVQLKPRIDEAVFASSSLPPVGAASEVNLDLGGAGASSSESVTRSAWRVERLPEGFFKVSHHRFTRVSNRSPTEHILLSDGLATVSVFVEKLGQTPPLLQGGSQMGSINAFGVVMDGHQILVVGEVPTATVQRIAASVQPDSEVGTP